MEKVYIVTSGEYSDYTIEAVFSTREKAEEFVSVLKLNYPAEIVEWNVDGIIEGDEARHYEATFAYETGELLLTEEVYMFIHLRPMIQAMPDNGGNFNIKIQFSTAKTDAVRKIASEIFMQVKALQPVKFPYLSRKRSIILNTGGMSAIYTQIHIPYMTIRPDIFFSRKAICD